MRIAYLVNQYPKVSHTFIRREIAALERQGVEVLRFALRGWDADVADPVDREERGRTHYLLQGGKSALLRTGLAGLARRPRLAWQALRQAMRLARRADRPWPLHLVYLLEAARLVDALQAARVQHLHAHFGTNGTEVALLARALGGPGFSFTVHGPEEFDKPEALHLADKVRAAAFVVAISSYGRSQLWRWLAASDWPKVQVVHCGLEPGFFLPAAALAPATVPRLVCVGRLCEQKGQLLLVQAAARLAAAGRSFDLVLAGDGEMRPAIEQAIATLGLRERVRITGWISSREVRDELLAARALVLPSFAEGLPVVLMEAMALGRPVITTSIAGIPELVRDGQDGWLVPAGDLDALTTAMAACLDAGAEQLAQMGPSALARVQARHHVDIEAARLKGLFEQAVAASGARA